MSDTEFAKSHLCDHLMNLLVPHIADGFWSIHSTAVDLCTRNGQPDQVLRTLQNMFTKIPEWSEPTLATEVERIVKATKCSYLDDLLMGVFIAYMKSFASLHYRGGSTHVQVDFERPAMTKFIHTLYVESARKLWQVVYLFQTTGVSSKDQAKNRLDIEARIRHCMEHVIRSFLPWESITRQFTMPEPSVSAPEPTTEEKRRVVFEDSSSDEEDEEDESEAAPAPLQLSDDTATIDVEDLDKDEEVDLDKALETTAKDPLVLNL